MSGKRTRDMKVRRAGVRPGVLADFLMEVTTASACLRRLGEAASRLPEGEQYYDARTDVNTMLNRALDLQDRVLKWGTA
jgi:hypothetical protein